MKIAILGAGAWGSALATAFSGAHEVTLWTRGADGRTLAAGVYFLRLAPVAGLSFAPQTARVVVLP